MSQQQEEQGDNNNAPPPPLIVDNPGITDPDDEAEVQRYLENYVRPSKYLKTNDACAVQAVNAAGVRFGSGPYAVDQNGCAVCHQAKARPENIGQ